MSRSRGMCESDLRGVLMQAAAEQDFDHLGSLNPAQRLAAEYGERREAGGFRAGPLLVIAGAGTGKTMTLAHRVAHLLIEGVSPERILLLTFTRRAAQEMTRRVENIVRASARDSTPLPAGGLPWSGTFHSIANRLLRRLRTTSVLTRVSRYSIAVMLRTCWMSFGMS